MRTAIMDNEQSTPDGRPGDATVLASVHRVEEQVLAGIRVNRRRKRGITIGASVLAGLGLFVGGVAVGAAALPPSSNPGANPGFTLDGHRTLLANQFAIDCYSSTSRTAGLNEMDETVKNGDSPSPGALFDERNPTGVCDTMLSMGLIDAAIGAEVRKLYSQGIHEGYLKDTNGKIYHFEADGPTTASGEPKSLSFDDGTETTVPGITTLATVPSPEKFEGPMAVCEAASNWVKVYPRGTRSAKAVCASVGLPVWSGR